MLTLYKQKDQPSSKAEQNLSPSDSMNKFKDINLSPSDIKMLTDDNKMGKKERKDKKKRKTKDK